MGADGADTALPSDVFSSDALRDLARRFGEIAVVAAVPVMEIYAAGPTASCKPDGSPVTEADVAAEAVILARLAAACPAIPVLAEESAATAPLPPAGQPFILVDPLDGTREFLERNGEFTVNIALILNGFPACGAVYAPACGTLWTGGGGRAERMGIAPGQPLAATSDHQAITARRPPPSGLVALVSRVNAGPATDAFLATLPVAECRAAGSSLKFCRIAEGAADVYPRLGPTMEWDTAAGHAVLAAAGGRVERLDGGPLTYGKRGAGFRNPSFVAWGASARE